MKKEELLETRRTRCGNTCVKLDKTAPWLSRVVTGKASSGRPLSRTHIIEFMRAHMHQSHIAGEAPAATDDQDDPMAAMDYDDMEHASAVAEAALATPRKHRKRTRRFRVEAEQIVSMAFPADILDGFADIHGDGGRRVTRLSCAKNIWLHVDDLAWVIRAMRHQYSTGGIPHCRRRRRQYIGPAQRMVGLPGFRVAVQGEARRSDVSMSRRLASPARGARPCHRGSRATLRSPAR